MSEILHNFEECGAEIRIADSERELTNWLDATSADMVLLTAGSGTELECVRVAGHLRDLGHRCPIVLRTRASFSVDVTLAAMRAGISDMVQAGDGLVGLRTVVRRFCAPLRSAPAPVLRPGTLIGSDRMIGNGSAVTTILEQIGRLEKTDANVLITGESGTGKELTADLIHRNSRRARMPFVALNCAAMPESLLESELFGYERGAFTGATSTHKGKLEHASDGTLFLDEIGDMSLASQAKMLRAIEQRVVQRLGSNVDSPARARLIGATNQNLEELTRQGKFRHDLYFRLNVIRIHLPPLRERREDIPQLTEHILRELAMQQHEREHTLDPRATRRLETYDWPGNIRELRNVIEAAVVFSSSRTIGVPDLPPYIRDSPQTRETSPATERFEILKALNSAEWNRGKAAEILHCSRMTLYRKMAKYAIKSGE